MALYGIDFYGATRYGPRVFLDYDAGPMQAVAIGGYSSLYVTWSSAGGAWSILRLVRNSFGTPVSAEDGVVLVESNSGPTASGTVDPPVRSYVDNDLEGGRFQYYAIFLYSTATGDWVRAAYTIGLPLKDHGYSNRLWELTPAVLRTKSVGLLDQDNAELQAYERVFGYQLDHIRTEYETLRDVNDPMRVSGNLLPMMAQQVGQFYEPELGMRSMRTLVANAVHLYRTKGTVPGVEAFVSALSGWGADVQPLKNLMLDYNDASAEETVGRWFIDMNGAVARYVADDIVNAVPDADPTASGMRNVGIFQQTSNNAGTSRMRGRIGNYESAATLYAIPVVGGQQYTFSGYARSATGVGASVIIFWMDAAGNYISEVASPFATTNDSWIARPQIAQVAPANAVWATVGAQFAATAAGQVVYWDAFQFEAGAAATPYTDARLIDIYARGSRVNLMKNPNFETDLSFWFSPFGHTLSRDTVTFHGGTAALRVVYANGDTRGVRVSDTDVQDNLPAGTYTISSWVRPDVGGAELRWTLESGTATVTLQNVVAANTAGVWQRISTTFTKTAGSVYLETYCTTPTNHYVDDVLLEEGADVRPYFDGTTYAFIGDSIWEGTANESRSHLYPQRRTKNYRLNALLPDYTPMGSSFRILYAQPI